MWEFLQQIGLPAAAFLLFSYLLLDKVVPLVLKDKPDKASDPKIIDKLEDLKRSVKAVLINQKENRQKLDRLERDVKDLRDCHLGPTARDTTGGYRWYMKAEALDAVEANLAKIARQMDAETEVLRGFLEQLKRLSILS